MELCMSIHNPNCNVKATTLTPLMRGNQSTPSIDNNKMDLQPRWPCCKPFQFSLHNDLNHNDSMRLLNFSSPFP